MKVNWLRISIIGAVVTAASILLVLAISNRIKQNELELVNREQVQQFQNMMRVQQFVAAAYNELAEKNLELEKKQTLINQTANSGLAQIRKMREDEAKRHDEVDHLPDDAVNRIILDGLAKYRSQRSGIGNGADPK